MQPKHASYVLAWSPQDRVYELFLNDTLQQRFRVEDEQAWQTWLKLQTSFAFRGQHGHLSLLKEARSRGDGYWYAYAYRNRRKQKHYLGTTRALTLAHVEETCTRLCHQETYTLMETGSKAQPAPPAVSPPFFSVPTPFPDVLLLPKLIPPHLPATLVTRERLFHALEQANTHPLTLVAASAGSGKTTLLAAWVAQNPSLFSRFAWLSLDERDNDPVHFWAYIIAALRVHSGIASQHQREPGETALTMLYSPQPPDVLVILTSLINDLMISREKMMLVLDDYHIIDDPAISHSLQFLLEHLPPNLHVILAGRGDPPLSLTRLRARGQMIEIRDQDLRFTRTETEQFLAHTALFPLTDAEIDVLEHRSEGWVTGLQLAALAMRTRPDRATFLHQFNGNQRFILEYIQEEILQHQPLEVQDFLMKTALLTRLHASLCHHVLGDTTELACQHMLTTLEKTNLFLTSLDEEQRWYRFHSLFRDVLLARLHTLSPDMVSTLHQRAARWYAQQGDLYTAVVHALKGSDYIFAATLMEQSSEQMWLNGKGITLYTWMTQLPDDVLLAHASLALTSVLHLFLLASSASDEQWQQAVSRAERMTERIEALVERQDVMLSPEEDRLLHNRLAFLHRLLASRELYVQGKLAHMQEFIVRMLELVREDVVVWQMFPVSAFSLLQTNQMTFIPLYSKLQRQAEQEKQGYEAAWCLYLLSRAYHHNGQLDLAYRIDLQALQHLQQVGKARSLFGYVHLHLARYHWTRNRLVEAQSHLETALQFAQTWQQRELQIESYCQLIPLLIAEGKLAEAAKALTEAQRLSQQGVERRHHMHLEFAQMRLWLAQGKPEAAKHWVAHCDLDPQKRAFYTDPASIDFITLPLIQVYLAAGRENDAHELLTSLLLHAERNQDIWNLMHILALQVLVWQTSGEFTRAQACALHLLQLAEPADYLRIYLDIGVPMQQVLQKILHDVKLPLKQQHPQIPLDTLKTLLAAFEQQMNGQHIPVGQPPNSFSRSSLAALTAREQEVLHLLAQGATNQDIASELVIALATVKKHVTNILNKLGAENRIQAIARARDSRLL
ncbi:LuxR family transcriptional regulator [Reticulibacter mediterranei]|uniref:LuxR family transcriptional regulator n=1 Tax=Reticulibacter mediterranei TaxID=2778369 RepID=A0A8J3J0W8_9CHLR|nr:LuxR C-terminal-related transcriptional regulator [Reticulibacter mediterranei]GHP00318.1 LuxR family transcriptional regulator [Reticulibacter mediterranei]